MATYKVIQDIEAEDKLLGPLTLRQFIYSLIAAFCLYICFVSITKHVPFLILAFLPIAGICGFFAYPFRRDQPTEVWALAKIRFMLKPHRRIWNQSGIKELVSITVPKRSTRIYTDGLSRSEVQSRLKALASTIDTRGWATKNVNVNLYQAPVVLPGSTSTDRLVNQSSLPKAVSDLDVHEADDVLDEKNNPTAYNFDQMIATSTQQHRQQVINEVKRVSNGDQPATPKPDYWFLNQPTPSMLGNMPQGYTVGDAHVVTPGADQDDITTQDDSYAETEEEKELAEELRSHHDTAIDTYTQHMKVIEPPGSKKRARKTSVRVPKSAPPASMTQAPDPAILALASNNDLNVATIARQANKSNKPELPEDEVVITLH